ncbi:Hypothetical predicted protein [Olea europaea subsp. europaea]|uniref:Uncharacterized protein n=1 Tax=Olea europaea subsp. europaea TaxID=158383 RepID=A0A8S0TYK0_OLEEU|nr:Hypothetical predicted protein [Olea europaea subsp. europaea]
MAQPLCSDERRSRSLPVPPIATVPKNTIDAAVRLLFVVNLRRHGSYCSQDSGRNEVVATTALD